MSDMDDTQIKAEIDGIMNGVRTIMQKIDDLTPKKEQQQEQTEDEGGNPDSSDNNPIGEA
jgi:peptidoglycan hydrolase CwlO-like protein